MITYPDLQGKVKYLRKYIPTNFKIESTDDETIDHYVNDVLDEFKRNFDPGIINPYSIKESNKDYISYTDPHDYVYLMDDGEFIKIGRSTDPYKRRNSMQAGSPRDINIVCTIPCNSVEDGIALESILHNNFAAYHIRGEWFDIRSKINLSVWLDCFGTCVDYSIIRNYNRKKKTDSIIDTFDYRIKSKVFARKAKKGDMYYCEVRWYDKSGKLHRGTYSTGIRVEDNVDEHELELIRFGYEDAVNNKLRGVAC